MVASSRSATALNINDPADTKHGAEPVLLVPFQKAMPATLILAPSNAQTLCKANLAMQLASKKASKAQARAELATEAANVARKRVHDEMMSAGVTKQVAASVRTSTKSFATKDPAHALNALACIDLNGGVAKHEFSELGVVAYKYGVRAASERMAQPKMDAELALYPSVRASAMMAAKTVRYVYDLALELATTQPEQYTEARRTLEWHTPQQMLRGRETRGAGIVMYTEATLELVKTALATAKERVGKRVEAAVQYASEMEATVAAATRAPVGEAEGV